MNEQQKKSTNSITVILMESVELDSVNEFGVLTSVTQDIAEKYGFEDDAINIKDIFDAASDQI